MLTALAVLCAAGAAFLSTRWFLARTDSLGRPRSFPTISVVLLLVYPDMPDDYRDGACAPGGPLDERLPTSPWVAGP